jgi:hypothetical protein
MWYAIFCEDEKVAERTARQLGRAKVLAAPHQLTLGGAYFESCILPKADRTKALGALGIEEPARTTPTDDPNYELILDRPVISLLPTLPTASAAIAVVQAFVADLGARVVLIPGYGAPVPVMKSPAGTLRIYFYALPALPGVQPPTAQQQQMGMVFGVALPGLVNVLSATGLGTPVQAPEGVIVAEALEGNLFILADLIHAPLPSDAVFSILGHILEAFVGHPQGAESDPRQAYIRICTGRARLRQAALEHKIREIDEELARASKLLALKSAEKEQALQELEALKQHRGSVLEHYGREYDKLIASPHVKEVRIEGGMIRLKTDDIFLHYNGTTRHMGRYEIAIPIEGGKISIFNERPKRQPDGSIVHHPHVHGPHGGVCFGELQESLTRLIASRHYAEAVQLVIGFLHQFKPIEHYLSYLELWEPLRQPRPCSCELKGGQR